MIHFIKGGMFIVALIMILILAVITDLSKTRIPNMLVLSGLIFGVFYRVLCMGERNYIQLLLGIAIPLVCFFPLFMCRAMGAGDIKLLMVTGTFFTIRENVKCIILAVLLGGMIALFKVLCHKNLRERMKYMLAYFGNACRYAAAGSYYDSPYMNPGNPKVVEAAGIKFSLPILLAAIIVMGGGV